MALVYQPAPLTSGARAVTTLGGVRLYLMRRAGRGGGHFASTSASGGMAEVVAFPEGAAFRTASALKAAIEAADAGGKTVVMATGVGAMLADAPRPQAA